MEIMSFDWTGMARADLTAIRLDNQISIAFRRGDTTLAAQNVRVEIVGSRGSRFQSDAGREGRQMVFILGEYNMDIKIEDRFTYGDVLFRVTFIQPNRLAGTIAEAVAVE